MTNVIFLFLLHIGEKNPTKIGKKCSLFFLNWSLESKVKPFYVVHTGILGCSFDSKS